MAVFPAIGPVLILARMSSHTWPETEYRVAQAPGAADHSPGSQAAPQGSTASPLGPWSADRRIGRMTHRLQRARYAGQAAAVLLVVVGGCATVAHIVFG